MKNKLLLLFPIFLVSSCGTSLNTQNDLNKDIDKLVGLYNQSGYSLTNFNNGGKVTVLRDKNNNQLEISIFDQLMKYSYYMYNSAQNNYKEYKSIYTILTDSFEVTSITDNIESITSSLDKTVSKIKVKDDYSGSISFDNDTYILNFEKNSIKYNSTYTFSISTLMFATSSEDSSIYENITIRQYIDVISVPQYFFN